MSKKKSATTASKKAIKQLVNKDLGSLIVKFNPEIGGKKLKKTIKRASRILVKSVNTKSLTVASVESKNPSTTA